MENYLTINIVGYGEKKIKKGTRLIDLAKEHKNLCEFPILLALVNNSLEELHKKVLYESTIEFLDIKSKYGFLAYQRTAVFIMIYAAKEILGREARVVIEHSINKNYYCEVFSDHTEITDELLSQIENRMKEIVQEDIVIEKHSLPIEEGIKLSEELFLQDKIQLLRYRKTANVNFYKLGWFYDYFYGAMASRTGVVRLFQLQKKEGNGFMLVFPSRANPDKLSENITLNRISAIFNESNRWAKILKSDTVGSLNDIICKNQYGDFIRVNEALHEKKISEIADMVYDQNKKIVLVAGPSSSGKTTFAHRLCIQLRVNGLKPHIISLDNYFLNRNQTPKDEFGAPNFEDLYAIDVKQINIDLEKMINGDIVQIPSFNFITGRREYKGKTIKLEEEDILVIEGIHGLNEKLTYNIPKEYKFKIFISALTQLNIDDHNRISTADSRLIRRIVRDSQFRGFDALSTIAMWSSVTKGEERFIFPFQEKADAIFNSALVYELCILKYFAEPLLFRIDNSHHEYAEAKRLLKFLDSFIGISSESVPHNSILREFIGGSCFHT